MADKLTAKQQAFVACYLTCWNATQAAKQAGYSDKTAYATGAENLKKPQIQAAIRERLTELSLSADEALTRLAAQARGSMAPFLRVSDTGELEDLQFANAPLHLIKKVTFNEVQGRDGTRRSISIELYDAQAALIKLGEHHQLFGKQPDLLKYLDLSKLSPGQLERLAKGDDPLAVLLNSPT